MYIDWSGVFVPDSPPLEIFVRGSVVYLVIFFLLRLVFRRETGTTGMTDILVLVLLADAAQNAMAGDYTAIGDGLLLVGTLVFWSVVIESLGYWFPTFQRITKPKPKPMVRNGRMLRQNMRSELMTEEELFAELRQRGARRLQDVEAAQMEPDGQISVVLKDGKPTEPAQQKLV